MHFNYVLLGKCEEVWGFGDNISPGMKVPVTNLKKQTIWIYWNFIGKIDIKNRHKGYYLHADQILWKSSLTDNL